MQKIIIACGVFAMMSYGCTKDKNENIPEPVSGNFIKYDEFPSWRVEVKNSCINENGDIMTFLVKDHNLTNNSDGVLVKYNALGDRVFEKLLYGANAGNQFKTFDYREMFWDGTDVGLIQHIDGRQHLEKFDGSSGSRKWDRDLNSYISDIGIGMYYSTWNSYVSRIASGSYIVAVTYLNNGNESNWLIKVDADGNFINAMDINSYFESLYDVAAFGDRLAVVGEKDSEEYLLIVDLAYNEVSLRNNDAGSETILIPGETQLGWVRNNHDNQLNIDVFDQNGNQLYQIDHSKDLTFNSLEFTADGGVIGAGGFKIDNNSSIYLEKFNSSGVPEWSAFEPSDLNHEVKGIKEFGSKYIMVGDVSSGHAFVGVSSNTGDFD